MGDTKQVQSHIASKEASFPQSQSNLIFEPTLLKESVCGHYQYADAYFDVGGMFHPSVLWMQPLPQNHLMKDSSQSSGKDYTN